MIKKSKEAEEHFDRGINYFRGGFFSSALQEFRNVKKLDGDYPNIDYILEAAIKKGKEVAGKLTNYIEENFDEEIRLLSEDLRFENSSHLGKDVEALLREDKPFEALKKLRQAESIIPDSRALLLLLANIQRRVGLIDEAEHTLARAQTLFPEDPEVLNNLGNIYLTKSMFKEAQEAFDRALEFSPDDPKIFNNLGSLMMQTNQLDEAAKFYRKALRQTPNWKTAQRNLSNLETRIQALDEEIESLRQEFFSHPNYLDVGLSLGKSLFFRGYFSEAKSVLKKIVKENPELISAYFYLGMIHELIEDYEKSIDFYKQMVIHKGKDKSPEYRAFTNLYNQGYLEEALVELKKIAIMDLDLASSRINLGIKYFEDCQWEEALRNFEEAVQINDQYPDAFYWIALSHIQLKNESKAKENLEKALELNPRYADAHFQLGMLLRNKAKKKSRTHLKEALELHLRESFAKVAKKILGEQK